MTPFRPNGADLAVGDTGPDLVVESIERADLVWYAGASGYFNPIHYHDVAAEAAGHPGVIAQGMFTAGLMETMLTDWLGVRAIRQFGVRFTDVVRPGDTVVVTGEVTARSRDGPEVVVEVELTVATGDETTVVSGEATAVLPAE
jgi:acyl dehydratase